MLPSRTIFKGIKLSFIFKTNFGIIFLFHSLSFSTLNMLFQLSLGSLIFEEQAVLTSLLISYILLFLLSRWTHFFCFSTIYDVLRCEPHWVYWICGLMFLIKFGKLWTLFFHNLFHPICLSPLFLGLHYMYAGTSWCPTSLSFFLSVL